ncbi:MAG: Dicer-like protein 2 [Bathelium mastoideum]|nr:MAG: Dicer-like protein 2 [Bathelium mastoideum]
MADQPKRADARLSHEAGDCAITLRSYQQEMFERSLVGNTIVVMETGSGKTPIAIFRIKHALEQSGDKRLIWFLNGGVLLCRQQHDRVKEAIPYATTKCIVGEDGPELWGSAETWRQVLSGVDIMFSTFAVLRDALAHAWINITDLGLLIFDEAHHVAKDNPANRIMQDFYHRVRQVQGSSSLPAILGLTASPTQNGKPKKVDQLESNLAATCQIPRTHRSELRQHVHRPTLTVKHYHSAPPDVDIDQFRNGSFDSEKRLQKLWKNTAVLIEELGWWAGVTFLHEIVASLTESLSNADDQIETYYNRRRLLLLEQLEPSVRKLDNFYEENIRGRSTSIHISEKALVLIQVLKELANNGGGIQSSGILFARQRIVVTMLQKLLAYHPHVPSQFRSAALVGRYVSTNYEQELSELLIPRTQINTLRDFRQGAINLIVSTDALDEGIDVAACNAIICFDEPANLRSYVQKRGRARQKRSSFVLIIPRGVSRNRGEGFEAAEAHINKIFDEEKRRAADVQAMESMEECLPYTLESLNTGAYLTAKDAIGHLHHFCNKIPRTPYVDSVPVFQCHEMYGLIRAEVRLPMAVPSAARSARSLKGWHTERAAIRDASFQAYRQLYEHGLLTEHLIPMEITPDIEDDLVDQRQAFNHMGYKASVWDANPVTPRSLFRTVVSISDGQRGSLAPKLALLTEADLTCVGTFELAAGNEQMVDIELQCSRQVDNISEEVRALLTSCTDTLMKAMRARYEIGLDTHIAVFVTPDLPFDELPRWLELYSGQVAAQECFERFESDDKTSRLVLSTTLGDIFAVFKAFHYNQDENGQAVLEIECRQLSRRRNFTRAKSLEQQQESQPDEPDSQSDDIMVPAELCVFRNVPVKYHSSMRFLPSILYHVEMILTGRRLQRELMGDVQFRTITELVQAITCPQTALQDNYERLEFLGDSVLKFQTTGQVYCDHPNWHEGYLTRQRNVLVSNISLAKAAVSCGLDKFILNEPFHGKHWTPPSEKTITMQRNLPRYLRMKTVADVVEALIGAAFLAGGLENARRCMFTISPAISKGASTFRSIAGPTSVPESNVFIERVESMISYSFRSKYLLLEALTHPSCVRCVTIEPYQRLEFLGDAVLDFIVVKELYERLPEASQSLMTEIKASLVNGDFLAFLCYSFGMDFETTSYSVQTTNSGRPSQEKQRKSLSSLLRVEGDAISDTRSESWARFEKLQYGIAEALKSRIYPWEQLCMLRPPKFVSDMVESLIGAIFVDTDGELEACRAFLERLGLINQLRQILSVCMDTRHPREKLQHIAHGHKLEHEWKISQDGKAFALTIMVDGKAFASVADRYSKHEAIVGAAAAACRSWECRAA